VARVAQDFFMGEVGEHGTSIIYFSPPGVVHRLPKPITDLIGDLPGLQDLAGLIV
jgi:hypothetical protein